MGLAKAVAVRFPAWGPDFVFLMVSDLLPVIVQDWSSSCYHPVTQRCAGVVVVQMSVIMMNLFSGPPMFRSAVISTGEARALQLPSVANDAGFPSPKCAPIIIIIIIITHWEPPEAHWSCGQSSTAHLHTKSFTKILRHFSTICYNMFLGICVCSAANHVHTGVPRAVRLPLVMAMCAVIIL